jgi:outer membrane protein assembly factor BamB
MPPAPSFLRSALLTVVGLLVFGAVTDSLPGCGRADEKVAPSPRGWPRFRGPDGNGVSSEKLDLRPRPEKVWEAEVGQGSASLIVQDGRLYTLGTQRRRGAVLCCLDADTGKPLWEQTVTSWDGNSSPTVAGDRLYLLCSEDKPIVYCCRTSDGKAVWRKELPKPTDTRHYGHAGSPLLWEDLVIVNAGLGTALKRDTGEVVWEHRGLSGLATPVLYEEGGKPAVLIFAGAALYSRDARSGRELWSIPWKTSLAVNACDPIPHQGKVFLSTDYGKHAALFDVSARPPRQQWVEKGSSFSSGFLWEGHLYCFADRDFACLDLATGKRKWSVPGVGGGSAILAGDKIILLTDRGRLHVAPVSAMAFRPALEDRIHGGTTWTPPSLVNGRLFVRNKEGQALCLRLGK